MTSPQMVRLDEHLQRLRLNTVRERLEALLQDASAKELSYADFLDRLLSEEVEAKTAKHVTMRTNLARFPFSKGLDSFDFRYQPSVDRKQVQKLSLCYFVEHGENLVLLGPPGVGKTHLAVGLGLMAIERGYRVPFTTAAAMLTTLTKALSEGRFNDKLKVYDPEAVDSSTKSGYLPIDHQAATLFFQLISRRYERGPMILTSNQSFGSWGDVFGDRVIASAILVRGGQADHGGNVRATGPWTLPVAMDALTRAHRDLDRPQNGLPTAPTGYHLVMCSIKGWGNSR